MVPPSAPSCLTAVYEKPPPHRTDKALNPVRDVHADCRTALVRRALTLAPDNAHETPLGLLWGLRARMASPGTGSAAQGPGQQASPVTPQNPGTSAALLCGVARGELTGQLCVARCSH